MKDVKAIRENPLRLFRYGFSRIFLRKKKPFNLWSSVFLMHLCPYRRLKRRTILNTFAPDELLNAGFTWIPERTFTRQITGTKKTLHAGFSTFRYDITALHPVEFFTSLFSLHICTIEAFLTIKNNAMKTIKLQNTMAACTGRTMLYCYRLYFILFKETRAYKAVETIPGKRHTRFTSNQFKTLCYN